MMPYLTNWKVDAGLNVVFFFLNTYEQETEREKLAEWNVNNAADQYGFSSELLICFFNRNHIIKSH